MPRYFFHVHGEARDVNGTEFSDLAVAKCAAVTAAGEILCDSSDEFWDRKDWAMTVTDESGLNLFQLNFSATELAAILVNQ